MCHGYVDGIILEEIKHTKMWCTHLEHLLSTGDGGGGGGEFLPWRRRLYPRIKTQGEGGGSCPEGGHIP